MRNTYIKPNSHTQQQATRSVSVVEEICRRAGIDKDTWLGLMFEFGCELVEAVSPHPDWTHRQLMDEQYGYWAWFLRFYIHDDNLLLKFNHRLAGGRYQIEKQNLINRYVSKDDEVQKKDEPGAGNNVCEVA